MAKVEDFFFYITTQECEISLSSHITSLSLLAVFFFASYAPPDFFVNVGFLLVGSAHLVVCLPQFTKVGRISPVISLLTSAYLSKPRKPYPTKVNQGAT